MREERSFCRLCLGTCGTRVTLDDDDRVVAVRGDKDHVMSAGYACIKGIAAPDLHNGPDRLLHPLKRTEDGFAPVALEQALDEIADRMERIIAKHGADAVGLYNGTQSAFNVTAYPVAGAFMTAIGSQSVFSTMTVDQSAKWVAAERFGVWGAGLQPWDGADVWMFIGTNPLVSVVGGVNGFISQHPDKRLKAAKARGMKLIVVDPRRTETAEHADLFLQVRPGEDVALLAGMLRIILAEGWHDAAFCADHVRYLAELGEAVAPFEPDPVAGRTGIAPDDLRRAASLFARESGRGCAYTGTGPSMSPRSNLAEHLAQALNAVCGRFVRAGEPIVNPGAAGPPQAFPAAAFSPRRSYEGTVRPRAGGFGMMFGERMSCTLADEILEPGEGQVRALLVSGANPVATLPDQNKVVRAFRSLDLLVAIEPYMTSTAKLCDYILPPRLMYERADLPMVPIERLLYPAPFSQYTPALASPPPGSDVVEDWHVFWGLAKRLGKGLRISGVDIDMTAPPETDALIETLVSGSVVPLAEIRRHPGGAIFPVAPVAATPPPAGTEGRLEVAPPDIVAELAIVAAEQGQGDGDPQYPHRLVVRRIRETINSLGPHLPAVKRRKRFNAVQLPGSDIRALGRTPGDPVMIVSAHGRIPAILEVDDTLQPGVASMAHGWGGLPEEALPYDGAGASPTLLIDSASDIEPINAMARLSSIPIRFEAPDEGVTFSGGAASVRPTTRSAG